MMGNESIFFHNSDQEDIIMELRVLHYFLTIAREQSISGAAEFLHISQPTLSRQMKDMEDELGKQLFVRSNRKITLTQEGRILRKRAEEILDLVKKTEKEVTLTNDIVMGDIYIGTGETDSVRLIARAAKKLQEACPGIRYHISSGNAPFVLEQLDKGLLDFGIVFGTVDLVKYNALKMPAADLWGVLMRKDSPLASKETIGPEDLWEEPLILSQQEERGGQLTQWLNREASALNIAATYNLIFNASLLVEEGLGYAIGLDGIINTTGSSTLCFRPLAPKLENEMSIIWKKYQLFSKPAGKFIDVLKDYLEAPAE